MTIKALSSIVMNINYGCGIATSIIDLFHNDVFHE